MEFLLGTYSVFLACLSLLISVFVTYFALDICERIITQRKRRPLWMICGSIMMGLGFWSMHFIGLMTFQLQVGERYDRFLLLLSMLLPVIAAWAILVSISSTFLTFSRLFASGVFMSLAFVGMHYTGMASMKINGGISFNLVPIAVSVLIAFTITLTAIWLIYKYRHQSFKFTSRSKGMYAVLIGLALTGMHYSGIFTVQFALPVHVRQSIDSNPGINDLLFAILIGLTTIFILLFVVFGQFMDRRFALRLAEMNKRRYDSIFEHNPDMVCLFDISGRLLRTNPATERITGYRSDELLSKPFTYFLNRMDTLNVLSCFAKVLKGNPEKVEFTIRHRTGRPVLLSTTIVPLMDDGRIVDIYTISKDITEQRIAEKELIQAKLDAENAARVKSEFLAIMSHEIRTPLNGVNVMAQMLLDTPLNDEQQEYVTIISKSGSSLLSVINDVLDFSKMESGNTKLQEEHFYLESCLYEIVQLFNLQIQDSDVKLNWQIDEDIPVLLIGDELRLRQVLINLIGNAVKFTDKGSIDINVTLVSKKLKSAQLEFTVKDTGIGIPPELISQLFQPFHQLHSSIVRKHGGTGLGLAICKRLVELMGGTIQFVPSGGPGATFAFTIDIKYKE